MVIEMSKKTKNILNSLLLVVLIGFILINLPYGKIKNAAYSIITNIDDFINNIDAVILIDDNSSFDQHIKNITFNNDNDEYYAIFEFNSINPLNVSVITINDTLFTEDFFTVHNNTLIVDITSLITSDDVVKIDVSTIYTKNNKEHISTLSTSFYKQINYETIEKSKKSVVTIEAKNSLFFNTSSAWGSGVILNKQPIIKSGSFRDYQMYEYFIVTNSHVVGDYNIFNIYKNNMNNEYPKNSSFFEPNETVELLGHYTKNTDLAFLLLTTFDDSLVPLDDKQFIDNEPVPINKEDVVYLIGSPFINNRPAFESYKIGKIENTSMPINLTDSPLCSSGCQSIKSTAYLGEGSSGGGLFDIHGNLIGINFAGSENSLDAFAIPITTVFEAINELEYVLSLKEKRSLATSFLFKQQLHNQFQQFLS